MSVYRVKAEIVEQEFRETLAVCNLLLRVAWPNYEIREVGRNLIDGQIESRRVSWRV